MTLASPLLSPEALNRLPLPKKAEVLALLERKAERVRQREAEERREAERRRIERDFYAIRERCESLAGFVREAWPILEPNTPLVWNWHLDALCLHLEAVTDGRINRLAINVPPGSSKSIIVSVLWPSWEWGPKGLRSMRYLTTSFAEDSVKRDTRKHRDLTLSEWYRSLWPEVVLVRTGEMSFANRDNRLREPDRETRRSLQHRRPPFDQDSGKRHRAGGDRPAVPRRRAKPPQRPRAIGTGCGDAAPARTGRHRGYHEAGSRLCGPHAPDGV